ncbi:MAG: undecaprenyl-diphosphate phosphatase, partial [Lachnospiraceae bacterium]|nr:undecaprenyl-diphosphate phosphatase [Lachnospiraceae bacterium]
MDFIEIIKAIFYGIVEGITEWLPISSTGHLILLERFIKMNVSDDFMNMFRVVIQLGAIMAVVVIYWKQIWFVDFHGFKSKPTFKKDILNLWGKIMVACVPAAIVGVFLDDFFEALFYNEVCVSIALIVFGIAFIIIETLNKKKSVKAENVADITYKLALLIGVFQLIAAIFPGTSRSGATIVGALLLGVSRAAAADFTFFLAIPVMFGASLLKIVKYGLAFSLQEFLVLLVAMIVAYAVSMIVIKLLLKFVKKHDFKVFGWYRIVLGIL